MVSPKSVEDQLKLIHFNQRSWGRTEISELPNILMPDEEIFECVNGYYEGGFALLCATNIRMLLIDKKPLKYLTVEDLRFDMINQIDYSHRLLGAHITVSAGIKNLKFTSLNQRRLRKLIDHIQNRMAEIKQESLNQGETQQLHLENINQQLQAYLLAQYEHQAELSRQLEQAKAGSPTVLSQPVPVAPPPSTELSDYLFAQNLLKSYDLPTARPLTGAAAPASGTVALPSQPDPTQAPDKVTDRDLAEIYQAGREEVFKRYQAIAAGAKATQQTVTNHLPASLSAIGIEINPLRMAYAKLPMIRRMRNHKSGHSDGTPQQSIGTSRLATPGRGA